MKKILLLIAVALCTALSSCDNDEPAEKAEKEIVAYFDADGIPHLFDEEQYSTQQVIDKLKNKVPFWKEKTVYTLDNDGAVSGIFDYWEIYTNDCLINHNINPRDCLKGSFLVFCENEVRFIQDSSSFSGYRKFADYPYDSESEKHFVNKLTYYGFPLPVKIYDDHMIITGIYDNGTPYYAKVYFANDDTAHDFIERCNTPAPTFDDDSE
ncbi:MAG: hypothetical protein K2M94_07370 [Paramuribaculum sp.]|nr:hypothetical protein [Paramuribaculum sp.]